MSEFARIESIDALKNLREYLCNFAQKISVAVDEADFDIQDTANWLKHDRYPYWQHQERLRSEQLIKARLELKRKKIMERAIGGHDSCIDEIKAVAAAERRYEEAQEKLRKAKSWMLQLEKDGFDCRGVLQSLGGVIRVDLVNYRAQIDQMIYALESYTNVAAPVIEMPAAARSGGGEVVRQVSPTEELEKLCKNLHDRKPLENISVPAERSRPPAGLKKLSISERMRAALQKNKQEAVSVPENEKVVFQQHLKKTDDIYFEHLFIPQNSEFLWYVGRVEACEGGQISAATVGEFIKEYPVLAEILSLPAGWMILVKKNSVEAVFNADNKLAANNGEPQK